MLVLNQLAQVLTERLITVCTAESCTAGGLAARLTSVSGSSAWFCGGVVSYTNKVKNRLLSVSWSDLDQYGAVSSQVAQAMAKGALDLFGCDWAVSVTGLAGPNGDGTATAVGTVWIGWASQGLVDSEMFFFDGCRDQIREKAVEAAVEGLLRRVKRS